MPKLPIDYSNSIVYKLCCKDVDITDLYIGSTTNMRQRKAKHKSACDNKNSDGYNLNVYKFIRDNGGFNNWSMIMIERVECDNKIDLIKRERYYIDHLKPSLNKAVPLRTVKEWLVDNKELLKLNRTQYYIENKEQIKQYHIKNKEQIKLNTIQYYIENKEQYKLKVKEYQIKNKEQIKLKVKEYQIKNKEHLNCKVQCECGSIYRKRDKHHLNTAKHHRYITNPFIDMDL